MVLFMTALAIGWIYVLYVICKAYINVINKRNIPTAIRRQDNAQSVIFNRVMTIASSAAFIVIMIVLAEFAIDMFTPPAPEVNYSTMIVPRLRTIAFVYGSWYAPGTIASIVYVVYIRQRLLGQSKSNLAETITILAAGYTFFAYELLQNA